MDLTGHARTFILCSDPDLGNCGWTDGIFRSGARQVNPLFVQCGLQDKPDTASETETTTLALPDSLSVPFVVDFASPTFAPPTFAPEPVVEPTRQAVCCGFWSPKTPDTDSDSGMEHRIGDQVDKRNIDKRKTSRGRGRRGTKTTRTTKMRTMRDADEDDEGDDNEDETTTTIPVRKMQRSITANTRRASHLLSSKAKTETPKPAASQTPEAVSTSIGLWILLLLIVGIGLAYWIPEQHAAPLWHHPTERPVTDERLARCDVDRICTCRACR